MGNCGSRGDSGASYVENHTTLLGRCWELTNRHEGDKVESTWFPYDDNDNGQRPNYAFTLTPPESSGGVKSGTSSPSSNHNTSHNASSYLAQNKLMVYRGVDVQVLNKTLVESVGSDTILQKSEKGYGGSVSVSGTMVSLGAEFSRVKSAGEGSRSTFTVVMVKVFELEIIPAQYKERGYIPREVDTNIAKKAIREQFGEGVITRVLYGGYLVIDTNQENFAPMTEGFVVRGSLGGSPTGGGQVQASIAKLKTEGAKATNFSIHRVGGDPKLIPANFTNAPIEKVLTHVHAWVKDLMKFPKKAVPISLYLQTFPGIARHLLRTTKNSLDEATKEAEERFQHPGAHELAPYNPFIDVRPMNSGNGGQPQLPLPLGGLGGAAGGAATPTYPLGYNIGNNSNTMNATVGPGAYPFPPPPPQVAGPPLSSSFGENTSSSRGGVSPCTTEIYRRDDSLLHTPLGVYRADTGSPLPPPKVAHTPNPRSIEPLGGGGDRRNMHRSLEVPQLYDSTNSGGSGGGGGGGGDMYENAGDRATLSSSKPTSDSGIVEGSASFDIDQSSPLGDNRTTTTTSERQGSELIPSAANTGRPGTGADGNSSNNNSVTIKIVGGAGGGGGVARQQSSLLGDDGSMDVDDVHLPVLTLIPSPGSSTSHERGGGEDSSFMSDVSPPHSRGATTGRDDGASPAATAPPNSDRRIHPSQSQAQRLEDNDAIWHLSKMELSARQRELHDLQEITSELQRKSDDLDSVYRTLRKSFLPDTDSSQVDATLEFLELFLREPHNVPDAEKELRADWYPCAYALLQHPDSRVDMLGIHDDLTDDEAYMLAGVLAGSGHVIGSTCFDLNLSNNQLYAPGATSIIQAVLECTRGRAAAATQLKQVVLSLYSNYVTPKMNDAPFTAAMTAVNTTDKARVKVDLD